MTAQSTTKTKLSEVIRIFKNIQRYSVDNKFVVSLREECFPKDEWALYKRPVSEMIADSAQLCINFDKSEDAVPFNVQVVDVEDIVWCFPVKNRMISIYVRCVDGLHVVFEFKTAFNEIIESNCKSNFLVSPNELEYKSNVDKICDKMFSINF